MTPALRDWFKVRFDHQAVMLDVRPPAAGEWQATLPWSQIDRVCFYAGEWFESDTIYVFTSLRPESYMIPVEADGGQALWAEIIRRKLFDAEVAITAAQVAGQLFCAEQRSSKPETETEMLVSPDQLPEIDSETIHLAWDQDGPDSIITWGEAVIWRERTGWEVYDRFEAIAAICKQKFGKRLKDIVPTQRSLYALYGDSTAAYFHVEFVRKALGKDE